jgi:hypothetical protein
MLSICPRNDGLCHFSADGSVIDWLYTNRHQIILDTIVRRQNLTLDRQGNINVGSTRKNMMASYILDNHAEDGFYLRIQVIFLITTLKKSVLDFRKIGRQIYPHELTDNTLH